MKRMAVLALTFAVGFAGAVAVGRMVQEPAVPVVSTQWVDIYRTPAGLVAGADLIVVARQIMSQPGRVVGTVPYTYNGFEIQSVLKGVHDGRELMVEQTGGETGGVVVGINDGGPFKAGTSYLLFLKAQGNGVYYQINHQARYEIDGGILRGVDPADSVVAAFHGRDFASARDMVRERLQMMQ